MAVVVPAPPALSGDLALFHTTDPLLSNSPVLVFHGSAATIGATSSRIQVHVFTPAGVGSYTRLAVSPTSPLYSAVSNLPREEQGDEICRGLAFGLKKYFAELPEAVKKTWCAQVKAPARGMLFGDDHVAVLATRMTRIENVDEVIETIGQSFGEQRQSWLDVDVILPPGSIKDAPTRVNSAGSEELQDLEALPHRYGRYAELIASLGDIAFLPTSKLKRAPSKPTSVGRSASFLRHHKESVRKEITELVRTEESYVDRVRELQDISKTLGDNLKTASREQLRNVIPDTLSAVLKINLAFLQALQSVLSETESAAFADLESTPEAQTTTQQARQEYMADTQGVVALAKCLCEWLPRLADSYGSYMKSQAESSQLLHNLFKSNDTAVLGALQEVGEQKLTSLLIEPVQRLPRYNLYIDRITKQLPVRHPAIKHLLRARDIVSDIICAREDSATSTAALQEKLRGRISQWPAECGIGGRLVAAVDFTELIAPYGLAGCNAGPGILLLFTDCVILLEKCGEAAVGARGLQTELENATLSVLLPSLRQDTPQPHDLRFVRKVYLNALDCTESHNGRVLQLFTRFELDSAALPIQPTVDSCLTLRLEGSHDGKAGKLVEDIVKAKVEGRYSEAERESQRWEVRASNAPADSASIFSAILEDSNPGHVGARRDCASVRIIVDIDRHSQRPRAGQNGIRTVAAVAPMRDGLWRLTVDSIDGPATREHATARDLVHLLSKRVAVLSAARFAVQAPSMTTCLLGRYAETLASIDLQIKPDGDDSGFQADSTGRVKRPRSPRKLLSTLLSSTGPSSQLPAILKDLPPLPPPGQLPRARLAEQMPSKPPSRESRPSSKEHATPGSMASVRSTDQLAQPMKKPEDTLSAYILALQARKGNIVGRSLKMRAAADEQMVNELYNSLLEDPNMMVLAAQATVDVLFAAFEKFLNVAWKKQIGQVVPYALMQDVQSKVETMFPTDFDEYFRSALSTLPPQNQRAFKGIMKLLEDLLDGTGNDGDRGSLTAAFAELLVTEGNPHDFIALIDRFVDNTDTYFGESLEEAQRPADDPNSSQKRAKAVNSASISANTSSLRRKFGFGTLSRANSKSEEESKVASVWRTLSKSTRQDASPGNSLTKASLHRSQSTEIDGRGMPRRPSSQDGPAAPKPSAYDDVAPLTAASSQNLGLSTIGEHPSFIPTGPPRKKRRSSLSDLKALEAAPRPQPWSPSATRRLQLVQSKTDDKSLPNSPMPSTPSSKGGSGRFDSPSRGTPRSRLPSSFRKENSPGLDKAFGFIAPLRPRSSSKQPDEVVITARPTSGIPTLAARIGSPPKAPSPAARTGLSERPGAGNIVKLPSPQPDKSLKNPPSAATPSAPAKRLKMQSPQKLRERLQTESTSLTGTQTLLQDELSKIGDELTATPGRIGSVRTPKTTTNIRGIGSGQPSTMDLAQRVLKMEGQLVKQVDELKGRIDTIQSDLSSSLTVSENKCKKLDELYREANGENEALYARFNDELGRILKAVRGGEGVEELKQKLKESQEDVAKLKRESTRLKRENVGLRAQLKE